MSNRWKVARPTLAAMLLLLAAVACGDDDPTQVREPVATVRLSKTQEGLLTGQTLQLAATPLDRSGAPLQERRLTWRSEDVAVATVSAQGLVTARGAGATSIVAASEGKEARAAITVTPPAPATVATVELAPTELAIPRTQTRALEATARDAFGMPLTGRATAWASEDDAIATVSNLGIVTAVAEGTTRVSATIEGKRAHATVIVTPPPTGPVASVTIDALALALEEGASRQLVATPRDAAGQPIAGLAVTWTTTDENVAHVGALGRVTGIRSGTATVTARINGKTAQTAVTVGSSVPYDLVFAAHGDPAAGGAGTISLYRLDFRQPGATPARITSAGSAAYTPKASPDGSKLAFAATIDGQPGLYVMDRDGGNRRMVVGWTQGTPAEPTWSPDGSKIAYASTRSTGASDIWVVNADGTNAVNLTGDDGANQFAPAWSPDVAGSGSRIAFTQSTNNGWSIWTMRPDGTDKRRLTTGDADLQPAWSPDGQTVAFQRSSVAIFGDIWLVNADGTNARALMPFYALPGPQWSPAWSPDGRMIAFTSSHETYGSGAPGMPVLQVYTVWADGSKLARRTGPDGVQKATPAWLVR